MRFEEEPVRAGGGGRVQERRDELPQAAARAALALARLLHRVGGVVDDRDAAGCSQAGEGPHVHHQIAVAEECAALGDGHLRGPARPHLFDRALHPVG